MASRYLTGAEMQFRAGTAIMNVAAWAAKDINEHIFQHSPYAITYPFDYQRAPIPQ
jgi:hypothetical protein